MIFNAQSEDTLIADLEAAAPAEEPDNIASFVNGALTVRDLFGSEDSEESAPAPEPQREIFTINSEDRANWYLRKKGNLVAERDRIKANAAAILADLKREEDSLDSRFGKQFEQWAKDELVRRKSRKKSLPLFQGVVSFRTVAASYSVKDVEAAFTYARTFLPEMIETKLVLNAGAYAAASKASRETETLDKESGELVPGNVFPGTEIKPEHESMNIKFVAPVGAIDADEAEDPNA